MLNPYIETAKDYENNYLQWLSRNCEEGQNINLENNKIPICSYHGESVVSGATSDHAVNKGSFQQVATFFKKLFVVLAEVVAIPILYALKALEIGFCDDLAIGGALVACVVPGALVVGAYVCNYAFNDIDNGMGLLDVLKQFPAYVNKQMER